METKPLLGILNHRILLKEALAKQGSETPVPMATSSKKARVDELHQQECGVDATFRSNPRGWVYNNVVLAEQDMNIRLVVETTGLNGRKFSVDELLIQGQGCFIDNKKK